MCSVQLGCVRVWKVENELGERERIERVEEANKLQLHTELSPARIFE